MNECYEEVLKGLHMGILGIDHVIDKIKSQDLKDIVIKQKQEYESLIHRVHERYDFDREPGVLSEMMVEMQTMFSDDSDIVKMLMKGCNQAVISMTQVIHKHDIDDQLQQICNDVEDVSKRYEENLKQYL